MKDLVFKHTVRGLTARTPQGEIVVVNAPLTVCIAGPEWAPVRAFVRCLPGDEFDIQFGAKLAVFKARAKLAARNAKANDAFIEDVRTVLEERLRASNELANAENDATRAYEQLLLEHFGTKPTE